MKKHCFQRRGEVATFLVLASLAVVSLGTLLGSLAQQKFFTTKSTAQSTNNATTSIKPLVTSAFPAGPMQQGNGTVQVTPWAGACEVQVLVKYGQPNFWLKFDGANGNSTTAYLGTVAYSGRNAIIRWNPKSQTGGTPMDPNEIQVIKYVPGYTLDRYQKPAWLGYGPTNVTIYHVDDTQNPNATVYYTTVQADGCLTPSNATPTVRVTPTPTLAYYEWSLMSDPADVCNLRVCENGPRPADPLRYFTVESNGTQIFKTANQSVLDKTIPGGGNIQCWNFPGRLFTYYKLQPYVGQNVTVAMRSLPSGNTEGFVNVKKDFKVEYSCFPNVPTPTTPPKAHFQLDLFKFIGSGTGITETSSPNCWGVWSNNCSNIPPYVETHQEVASRGEACSTNSVITSTDQRIIYTNSKEYCETVRCDYHECSNSCSAVDPTGRHNEDYICIKQPATNRDQKELPPGCTATCTPAGVKVVCPNNQPPVCPNTKTYQLDWAEHPTGQDFSADRGFCWASWADNCPGIVENNTTGMMPVPGTDSPLVYSCAGTTSVNNRKPISENKVVYSPTQDKQLNCVFFTCDACVRVRGNNIPPDLQNLAQCNTGVRKNTVVTVPAGCTGVCTADGVKITGSDPKCANAAAKATSFTSVVKNGKTVSTVRDIKPPAVGRSASANNSPVSASAVGKPKLTFLGCAGTGFRSMSACDVNGDGKINAYDFQKLLTQ